MSADNDLKSQRDRFLAFAFASADFLIEIDREGKILFTSGATKFFTGHDDNGLYHTDSRKLFSANDIAILEGMQKKAHAGSKQGPYLVTIKNPAEETPGVRAFISGFSIEEKGSLYISVAKGDGLLRIMGFEADAPPKISSSADFETLIAKKIPELMAAGANADMTLLELAGLKEQQSKLDEDSWSSFMSSIAEVVMAASIDGETAASLEDGKYVILQEAGAKDVTATLEEKIKNVAKKFKMDDIIDIKSKTVEGDLSSLTEREATRAIIYTMNKMEKDGLENCGDDLKKSFKFFLEENTNKIKNLKNIISHQRFSIHFQPIVELNTLNVTHHEVLARFNTEDSPYELIVLGEDVGIAPDIDMSVCRQTLKYADKHKKDNIGKLAVNLSGVSIQNEQFVASLIKTLKEYPDAAKHVLFEITESSNIKNLDMVDGFIQQLRKAGHQVCLDDFGAGAASFQYLHKLSVDGVKIDGVYTKAILNSPRDATMIKNLTQMCHELDIYVVAEFVETEDQSKYLRDIGVDKGQGWLFGKAQPEVVSLLQKQG